MLLQQASASLASFPHSQAHKESPYQTIQLRR
jgi:hypothetical protein